MRCARRVLVLVGFAACALIGAGTSFASGTIVFDGSPGTGAPPATLGPYSMTPFGADLQPLDTPVGGVAGPGGDVLFSPSLYHERIGQGWATWSHGYPGDVYATLGPLSATVTLPPGTSAFYLYAEPDPFAVFNITAVAQDGTTSGPIAVDGFAGAPATTASTAPAARPWRASRSAPTSISRSASSASAQHLPGTTWRSATHTPRARATRRSSPGRTAPSDYCHRSPQAYSEVLGAFLGSAPLFYACSGAVTSDITSTSKDTEPPQLLAPGVDPSADLVTMTIGGNDAGFSDVLKTCIEQKLKADAFNAAIGPVAVWLGLGMDSSCAHSDSFVSSVNTHIDNVFLPVKTTEQQLLAKVDPVNTSVIVADYPLLFPASHDDQNCLSLSIVLTNDDQDFMNTAGDRLDSVLQTAGRPGGGQLRRRSRRIRGTRDLRPGRLVPERHQHGLRQRRLLHLVRARALHHPGDPDHRFLPSERVRAQRRLRGGDRVLHRVGAEPDERGFPGESVPAARPAGCHGRCRRWASARSSRTR